MIVVSDASPLINLAWVGGIDLLKALYGELLIPPSVWHEVAIQGVDQPGASEIRKAEWIHVEQVANADFVKLLRQDLDAGEAEAIALAIERKADLLLMDERLGRQTAVYFNLRTIGVVGILIEARHKDLIQEIKVYLDALRDSAGFYIKPALYQRVLREQGEIE